MADTIQCPSCNVVIEVSAVLSDQLRRQLQKDYDAQARRKDEGIARREQELCQREQAVEASRSALEEQVAERLAQERPALMNEALRKAKDGVALEVRDLASQLSEAERKLEESQRSELELRKERRDLEAQKQELELTVNRRLDEERAKVREDAKNEAAEENRLREADKDKLVADLRRQIGDLKRMSEVGSQQAQGEVMEAELEELLREHFPQDTIEAGHAATMAATSSSTFTTAPASSAA